MDDELLWEVILSYVGNGSKAAPTAKILGAAARSRAARPYFLTALKRGAAPVALPARLESAARRIGGAPFATCSVNELARQGSYTKGMDGKVSSHADDDDLFVAPPVRRHPSQVRCRRGRTS